jgi:hypothetical protein
LQLKSPVSVMVLDELLHDAQFTSPKAVHEELLPFSPSQPGSATGQACSLQVFDAESGGHG